MNPNNLLKTVALLAGGLAPLALFAGSGETAAEPETKAISFPISYTGEMFGNLSGGYKQGAIYEGLLNVGVQGDLNKLAGWEGASFLVSAMDAHGPSLSDKYVHDLNHVSNIDTYDSLRLYEAWLQQDFDDGKGSIRLGQLLADTEFFVSDQAALFINGAFGALPLVSQSLAIPAFPQAIPGVRVRWNATDAVAVQAGVFEGNAGEQDGPGRHGLDWNLHRSGGVLALTEIAYTANGEKGATGLRGVYKLGAFFHSSTRYDDFPDKTSGADAGGYAILDQQLWREPGSDTRGLGGFLRIGAAPSDRNVVPFYFDTGFNYTGLIPGRDKDVAGVAFSATRLSHSLRDEDGDLSGGRHECIIEATYKVAVNDWLYVQPDFQYICNPGGDGSLSDAIVAGIRFNLSF